MTWQARVQLTHAAGPEFVRFRYSVAFAQRYSRGAPWLGRSWAIVGCLLLARNRCCSGCRQTVWSSMGRLSLGQRCKQREPMAPSSRQLDFQNRVVMPTSLASSRQLPLPARTAPRAEVFLAEMPTTDGAGTAEPAAAASAGSTAATRSRPTSKLRC